MKRLVRRTSDSDSATDAVAYDPSDPEANKRSAAEGRQVVYGGSCPAGEWEIARRAGVLPPAGTVTPSPKPYGEGEPLNTIPEGEWTPGMRRFAEFANGSPRITWRRCLSADCAGI